MARVLVESPPFPMAIVADVLTGCGVAIEARGTEETGADVVGLLGWQPVVAADFARYPALKVIACCGVGFDQVDLAQARRQGVWVCNVPDYCVEEMADTTIALLLALVRGIIVLDRSVRAGQWDDHAAGP
ncbi:MAG TPA: hypothetical protein VET65_03075, partial [Candidatus Limnocylindrales bacterium]|nr:hypothetical protein [Candidatus Limnocylindrales bacterium]